MTTQEHDHRWRREGSRAALLAGHFAYYLLAAALAAGVLYNILGRPGWLDWPATALWFAWYAALAAQMLYHDSHLCERCIAAAPLNPQAAVDRWKPALGQWHRVLANLVFSAAALALIWVHWHPAWLWYALNSAGLVLLAVFWLAEYQHRRLYPWCPWCHWGGGGDEELVPDAPVPDIEKV